MTVAPRRTPAIAFLPLMAPYDIASGYVSVTLAWQLRAAGMGAAAIAGLVALSIWPNTWKMLWAPLVDATLGSSAGTRSARSRPRAASRCSGWCRPRRAASRCSAG